MPKMLRISGLTLLVGAVLFAFSVAGCVLAPKAANDISPVSKKCRLLVLPFIDMASIFGPDASVMGPATGQVFVTGQVDEDAAEHLDTALRRQLAKQTDLLWTVTGPNLFNSVEITNRHDHIEALRSIGSARSADVVLGGYLYIFEERRGGAYGVERPARIAFEMALIQVDSGQLLWHRKYAERQQSLSEDLLAIGRFFKRKGRWVSALEMGELAISEMLPDMRAALPY